MLCRERQAFSSVSAVLEADEVDELNLPRHVLCCGFAEEAVGQIAYRSFKIDMVECIQKLTAKLELGAADAPYRLPRPEAQRVEG